MSVMDIDCLIIIENILEELDSVKSLENQFARLSNLPLPAGISPKEYYFFFERGYYKDLYQSIKEVRTYNTFKYVLHNALIGTRFEYNHLVDWISLNPKSINQEIKDMEKDTLKAIYVFEQKLKLINQVTEPLPST
tara:strand:+ start:75 stop:482 length:408 start_codon:yes stop_codon:yes gene_type:complete